MAIYNFMLSMVIISMVHRYGIGQMVKSVLVCDVPSKNDFDNCVNYNGETKIRCDPHHSVLIKNITVGFYNEKEEQTCCQWMPDNICTVDLGGGENTLISMLSQLECIGNQTCSVSYLGGWIDFLVDHDSCSSQTLMANFEYMCVSNTSIGSINKPWINHNLKSVSLFYDWERPPVLNGRYYCSIEIRADDNDAYIYPWFSFLLFSYRSRVTIYSRDYRVSYKANMTRGERQKYLAYKQMKPTKGPIYVIYETPGHPFNYSFLWINFKASRGRLNVNSKGCKSGYTVPPMFNIQPSPPDQTSSSVPPIFNVTSSPGNDQTTSSDNIWIYGLIGGLVIVAVFGLVKIGFAI